jgi:hypothetical protein
MRRAHGSGGLHKVRGCRFWYAHFSRGNGRRVQFSTRTTDYAAAEEILQLAIAKEATSATPAKQCASEETSKLIEELLSKHEATIFSSAELETLLRPCVYVFLDANDKPLYVGASIHGVHRVLNPGHHAKRGRKKIKIIWVEHGDVYAVEKALIASLRPPINREKAVSA